MVSNPVLLAVERATPGISALVAVDDSMVRDSYLFARTGRRPRTLPTSFSTTLSPMVNIMFVHFAVPANENVRIYWRDQVLVQCSGEIAPVSGPPTDRCVVRLSHPQKIFTGPDSEVFTAEVRVVKGRSAENIGLLTKITPRDVVALEYSSHFAPEFRRRGQDSIPTQGWFLGRSWYHYAEISTFELQNVDISIVTASRTINAHLEENFRWEAGV